MGGGWSVRQGTKVSAVYGLYTSAPRLCIKSLHSDFSHKKAESRPYGAGLAVSAAYTAAGLAVIALNLLAAVVGAVSWQRNVPSVAFWYLLRAAQIATGFFVLFACVVYATGYRASDELHYLYVFLPVAVSFLAELMRGASASQELGDRLSPREPKTSQELGELFAGLDPDRQQTIGLAIIRRETAVMTLASFVIAFLIWRALDTTTGMF